MHPSLKLAGIVVALALLAASGAATGVPGTHTFVEDARCDPHDITLTHELGEAPDFPTDELISATSFGLELTLTCTTLGPGPGGDPPVPDDFIVTITNLSPFSWIDLFFVADAGILVGNSDGTINGGDAFAIDTSGVNAPLLSESIVSDLIFSPGEAWVFIVQDWSFLVATPDIMGSIGVGLDSASGSSWSSIVAICLDCTSVPVPEPGSLALVALGVAALGAVSTRRRFRRA